MNEQLKNCKNFLNAYKLIKYCERLRQTVDHIRQLTPREKEVMYLVIEGLQTKIIADRLNISINTAECHRAKVMKKNASKICGSSGKVDLCQSNTITLKIEFEFDELYIC